MYPKDCKSLIWKENNKEGIEIGFKTPVSFVSGGRYYRFDDFVP